MKSLKRSLILATLAVFLFSSITASSPVAALAGCTIPDKADPKTCLDDYFSSTDILFYDPNADECTTPVSSTGVDGTTQQIFGNDNAEKIFSYLTGKGLTGQQAAGMLGNFQQESGFDPAIIQGGAIADKNYTPVNGVGFGIAQWTFTARQGPLIALAQSSNRSVTDLSLQLDFLWQELNSTHANSLASLKNESTPERAAYVFHRDFEGSADSEAFVIQVRGGNARALYEKYKLLTPSSTTTTAPQAGCTPLSSDKGTGLSDFLSDQFTIYDQCDSNSSWSSQKTPRGETMCKEAATPTALAMIAKNMTGSTTNPSDVIDYYTSHGLWSASGGSSLSSPLSAAGEFGLRVASITDKGNISAYKAVFAKGGLIMAISTGTSPFASNRHTVVIRGITSSGEFMIADPNPPDSITNTQKIFTTDKILTDIRSDTGSVVYAFYKK
jgi:hypothetical protein